MKYPGVSIGSNSPPKLLGTYELELHDCIKSLIREKWSKAIVVGAAEGYYAVGVAAHVGCPVVAFEQEESGHKWLRKMAEHNGMGALVEIRGRCESTDLQEAISKEGANLIIMDVEGYETVLLGSLPTTAVRESTLLIEIHEGVDRQVTAMIHSKFSSTHDITEYMTRERKVEDFTGPRWLSKIAIQKAWVTSAMDESRGGPMTWILLQPKSNEIPYRG
ncbi:hypothetical protein SAMN02745166_04374 [Prosthecobacter debontii]|uniref:Methyltransferase FkbM domain-containing protein n=1 Tax=Prosthecobacter debontii TaxID=48467 RepID=A0A1T4YXF6_9BACT|nr:hypothetical protein [Prosthecobacter debontii]SKB05935.1 hypothetical protein SAMN02745166_04374 [Prosthecobacter debontii]